MYKNRKKWNFGKTIKKPYTKSKRFDLSCRCHGGCPYCFGNRYYKHIKRFVESKEEMESIYANV